jgi:hypothetical protein
LLGVLALLCLENLARAGLSLQQAVQLPTLPTALSPIYVALSSAAWAVVYLVCIIGIVRQTAWAWWATVGVAVLYQAYLWVTRLAFARSSEAYATLVFRVILSVFTLVVVLGLVGLWQLRSRGEQEHRSQGAKV